MTAPALRRGPRRTREELHDLLVATGVAMALEEGVGTGADELTLARVFDRVEAEAGIRVTNASVIGRIWDGVDDFRVEVLTSLAEDPSRDLEDAIIRRTVAALADVDRSTPEGRWAAAATLARAAGAASLELITASRAWQLQVGAWALAAAGAEADWFGPIRQAIARGYAAFTAENRAAYAAVADHLGFRVRPGRTLEQFSVAVDALADGCALRAGVIPEELRTVVLPTGPGGEGQEWTLLGVGIHALVRQFFELDPDWVPDDGPGPVAA